MVWTAEFINTALEAVVDLAANHERHDLARVSKDVGAAAVLIAALASILIGLLVIGPPLWEKFEDGITLSCERSGSSCPSPRMTSLAVLSGGNMTLSFRFGTVGSPMNTPKKPGGSVGAIQYLRQLGLDALELGWVRAVRVTPETCAAIHRKPLTQDVAISVHAPYFINLNADDEEWPKSRQRLMDAALLRQPGGRHGHRLPSRLVFWPAAGSGAAAGDRAPAGLPGRAARRGQPRPPAPGDDGQIRHARLAGRHAGDEPRRAGR